MKHLIKTMKRAVHLFVPLMAFAAMTLGTQGCHGNEDEPEGPKETFRLYNEKDSAAFCEVLKTAYGGTLDQLCAEYDMRLDSVPSWPSSMVIWGDLGHMAQRRIIRLHLMSPRYGGVSYSPQTRAIAEYQTISPAIWEMDSLTSLSLYGYLFVGDMPSPGEDGKRLEYISLKNTGVTSLPIELFTIPTVRELIVSEAYRLENLPDGLDRIPAPIKYRDGVTYKIINCALSGTAPVECPLNLGLWGNYYNEMDWEAFNRIDVASRLVKADFNPFFVGTHLSENRLSGKIPSEVLADTLRLIYLHKLTYPQQDGYGFSNMPDMDELSHRQDEYCASHPEIAPLLSRIIIDPVWRPDSSGE